MDRGERIPLPVEPPRTESEAVRETAAVVQGTPPSSTAAHVLVVRVENAEGAPIAGATVGLLSDEAPPRSQTTDGRGLAMLAGEPPVACHLTASAPGYAISRRWLREPSAPEITVQLRPEQRVSGRVHLADGSAPPAPMRVVAWPTDDSRPAAGIVRAHLGESWLPTCTTARDGSFELGGLDPERRYEVGAGATGWVSPVVRLAVGPEPHRIDLPLARVFAAMIRLREPGDVLPPRSAFARRDHAGWLSEDAEHFGTSSTELALAGLGAYAKDGLWDDWSDALFAFKSTKPDIAPPELEVAYSCPGYENLRVRTSVEPVVLGIPVRTAYLQRTTTAFGTLAVALGTGVAPRGRASLLPTLTLLLTNDALSRPLHVPIYELDGNVEVGGVPCGEYSVAMQSAFGEDVPLAVHRVTITANARAEIAIAKPNLATFALGFKEPGGREVPDMGLAAFRVENRTTGVMRLFGFQNPPYVLEGLPPGSYAVTVLRGCSVSPPERSDPPRAELVAVAGETREHYWQLSELTEAR